MVHQDLREIFEKLEKPEHIGRAIRISRLLAMVGEKELVINLQLIKFKGAKLRNIRGIENGRRRISFEQLVSICAAIGCRITQVIKCAISLKERENTSSVELLKQTMEEIDYLNWQGEPLDPLTEILKQEVERRLKNLGEDKNRPE